MVNKKSILEHISTLLDTIDQTNISGTLDVRLSTFSSDDLSSSFSDHLMELVERDDGTWSIESIDTATREG